MIGCAALAHAWALCNLPHRCASAQRGLGLQPRVFRGTQKQTRVAGRVACHGPCAQDTPRSWTSPTQNSGRMLRKNVDFPTSPLWAIPAGTHFGQNSAEARPAREALLHAPTSLVLEVLRNIGDRRVGQSRHKARPAPVSPSRFQIICLCKVVSLQFNKRFQLLRNRRQGCRPLTVDMSPAYAWCARHTSTARASIPRSEGMLNPRSSSDCLGSQRRRFLFLLRMPRTR
jgi:hypothetical protein